MFIVNNRKFFFLLSAVLILASFFSIWKYGFNLGIDFKGGSVLEVSYAGTRPEKEVISAELNKMNLGNFILTPSGDKNFILKTLELSAPEKVVVMSAFQSDPNNIAKEEKFSSIGPVVGEQLKKKAVVAIAIVLICILLFITFAFRKVSKPVASWKYALVTIIALLHDVIIPTGFFVVWNHFTGGEIDLLFVTALLAILGYSVHDTIVVFDRVRESLRDGVTKKPFVETVGEAVSQTMARSINTSVTTFLSLTALYFVGGETTKDFALLLLVGIVVGAYSSIFVASPLLVTLEKFQKN
ncbi:MAG: preprotein translocase subunit SecF [Parcubacteria bacterium C7867-003]|nr:MAG: preprotein translocase subunit SecF [Parcubacteria bacterium C7867-003]